MKITIRRTILGILAAALCAPALAAQQGDAEARVLPVLNRPALGAVNETLPSWLQLNGEYRVRFEAIDGAGYRPDARDAFLLGRLRLNFRVAPSPWLRMLVQLQDAQAGGRNAKPDGPPFEDTMDLRQAYVEFGDAETQTVALRVGRQELALGGQRLVGHLNWTNTARSFDAVRATLRYGNVRVDAFAAAVVNLREGFANKSAGGNNLHGAYGAITNVVPMGGAIEPYAFWKLERGARTESGAAAKIDRRTYGVRFYGRLPGRLDYAMEAAGQDGAVGEDDIAAWAGHWALGYVVAAIPQAPRIVAEYNFASGDADPADGRQGTFDQLYPTGHDKLGLADQVGWKNIHDVRGAFEIKPTPKLSLVGTYHSWWLASPRDGVYNAGGALAARVADGSAGRHVGQEAAIQGVYAISTQLQLGGGYANVFPGTFLKNATPGRAYRSTYAMFTFGF